MSTRHHEETVAVILAAGEGRRMGMPKALLEYAGEQSFLDRLAACFDSAGCGVLVVLGHDAAHIRAVHPALDTVENTGWSAGQFSSARVGIEAALARRASYLLICPVDIPDILPSTVEAIRGALVSGAEAVVPTFEGERGHPLGLGRAAAERVLSMRDAPHLEAALRHLPVCELAVEDPAITRDADTPEEHLRLLGRAPRAVRRAGSS